MIPSFFNRKNNLFDMCQDDVEDAFHKLVSKYIYHPIKEFYREWNKVFEEFFENIDIRKHTWKQDAVLTLDGYIKDFNTYYLIKYKELSRYVSLINAPSIAKNRSRLTRELYEVFKSAKCIRITGKNKNKSYDYEDLLNVLLQLKGEEEQWLYIL